MIVDPSLGMHLENSSFVVLKNCQCLRGCYLFAADSGFSNRGPLDIHLLEKYEHPNTSAKEANPGYLSHSFFGDLDVLQNEISTKCTTEHIFTFSKE